MVAPQTLPASAQTPVGRPTSNAGQRNPNSGGARPAWAGAAFTTVLHASAQSASVTAVANPQLAPAGIIPTPDDPPAVCAQSESPAASSLVGQGQSVASTAKRRAIASEIGKIFPETHTRSLPRDETQIGQRAQIADPTLAPPLPLQSQVQPQSQLQLPPQQPQSGPNLIVQSAQIQTSQPAAGAQLVPEPSSLPPTASQTPPEALVDELSLRDMATANSGSAPPSDRLAGTLSGNGHGRSAKSDGLASSASARLRATAEAVGASDRASSAWSGPPPLASGVAQSAAGQPVAAPSASPAVSRHTKTVEVTKMAAEEAPQSVPTVPTASSSPLAPTATATDWSAPAAADVRASSQAASIIAPTSVVPAEAALLNTIAPTPPATTLPVHAASSASLSAATPADQAAPALLSLTQGPGSRTLILQLDPAELGLVHIRLDRPEQGPASVSLTVQRPETLALLVHDQAQLHRALDQAGVPADGRTITFHLARSEPVAAAGSVSTATPDFGHSPGAQAGGSGQGRGTAPNDGSGAQGGHARRDPASDGSGASTVDDNNNIVPAWARAGVDITA